MKKNALSKLRIGVCALVCFTFVSLISAAAKVTTVNLIEGAPELVGSVSSEYTLIENIDVVLKLCEGVPYQSELKVPNLPNNYVMSGKIHIDDVIATAADDISIWNGLRIIIGKTDSLTYNTVSIYRNVGIQLVNHSTVGVGDIKPYPAGFTFADNTDFTFEIKKNGSSIIFSVNGTEVINYTLAAGEDFFTASGDNNLGFISINTHFVVSDLKVLVEIEQATETQEPVTNPKTGESSTTLASLMILLSGCIFAINTVSFKKRKT